MAPRHLTMASRRAQEAPRWTKMVQRWPKEAPRWLQRSPRWALRLAKKTSRWPKDGSKRDHKGQNGCQHGLGKQNLHFSKHCVFPFVFSIKMASHGVKMAPFGALKLLVLDHFDFKELYGGICWLKIVHIGSFWGDLGLSWSALGLT